MIKRIFNYMFYVLLITAFISLIVLYSNDTYRPLVVAIYKYSAVIFISLSLVRDALDYYRKIEIDVFALIFKVMLLILILLSDTA